MAQEQIYAWNPIRKVWSTNDYINGADMNCIIKDISFLRYYADIIYNLDLSTPVVLNPILGYLPQQTVTIKWSEYNSELARLVELNNAYFKFPTTLVSTYSVNASFPTSTQITETVRLLYLMKDKLDKDSVEFLGYRFPHQFSTGGIKL